MQKVKKFLLNSYVQSIIISLLPLIYGIIFPLSLENGWKKRNEVAFLIAILLVIAHIVVVIVYSRVKLKIDDVVTESYKEADKFIHDISISLYDTISAKNGHSNVEDWSFLQSNGDIICREAHKFIKNVALEGNDFSVSVIFKQNKNGEEGFTMIARKSDENSHNPASYRNFIPKSETEGMYYRQIFDLNPTSPQILYDKRAISEKFKDHEGKDYSQYIGLPILCKDKAVAILQVVAYNNSKIAKEERDIRKLCDDYLSLYANLLLLTDKIENAIQLIKRKG